MLDLLWSTRRYPIEGAGRPVLLAGALGLTVTLALLPEGLLALPAVVLLLLVLGAFAGYLFDVLVATASGDDDPPEWPDPRDLAGRCAEPFLHATVVAGAAFAPAGLAFGVLGARSPLSWILLALGILYFPTAISTFGLTRELASLSPLRVARSVVRYPGFLAVSALLLLVMAASVPARLLGELAPVLGAFGIALVWTYGSMLLARMLGVLHREHGSPRPEVKFEPEPDASLTTGPG